MRWSSRIEIGEWGMGNGVKEVVSRLPTPHSPISIRNLLSSIDYRLAVEKCPHDQTRVAAFDIGFVIHPPHLLIRNLSRQAVEDGAQFGMAVERFTADHGDGMIGWEVTTVVFERVEIQFRDQPVGGVAGDQIDLFL